MKLLLTSAGITNVSIRNALNDLLGKPISECSVLCVPTGMYPFRGGGYGAYRFLSGTANNPMCELGWKSLGVLELTALPSVKKEYWTTAVQEADALLVWGGDVLYLRHWMQRSGLAELFRSLRPEMVYVGVSAGSMVVTSVIAESYGDHQPPDDEDIRWQDVWLPTSEGESRIERFAVAPGIGLVDLSLFPHMNHERFPESAAIHGEKWAALVPTPMYGIDDQTAIKVVDGAVEIVSEGDWKLFGSKS